MEVGLLGPLQVGVDGNDVTPTAAKERSLLALLALEDAAVSSGRLIEELWPRLDDDRGRRVLHVRVAALRKALMEAGADGVLRSAPAGYRLDVVPEHVDALRFEFLVEQARAERDRARPAAAVSLLRDALALWRGEPLAGVELSSTLAIAATRLAELRLGATEELIDAELSRGRHGTVVAELAALTAANPLRERLWGQWVLALYRCGRQVEALRAWQSLRDRLVEEVGVEPGPELQALHRAILDHEPTLTWRQEDRSVRTDGRSHVARPRIRYAKTVDGVHIAYQVVGSGPRDVLVIPGFASHLDSWWDGRAEFFTRHLASRMRVIFFDKRGMGLSDRPSTVDVEHWVEDARAVLGAATSEGATVVGISAGGPTALTFAAAHPSLTSSLVLYGGWARLLVGEDYPHGTTLDAFDAHVRAIEAGWGSGVGLRHYAPSVGDDPLARDQFAAFQRASASPGAAAAYLRVLAEIDVRHVLPMVSAPTLVLHARGDAAVPVAHGRYVADRVEGARFVELPTSDHLIWMSDASDRIAAEIEAFVLQASSPDPTDRVLATVLRVGTTSVPAESVGTLVEEFRGRLVNQGAPGVTAVFDGPARGIRCAAEIVQRLERTGCRAGIGLHSGECELSDHTAGGTALTLADGIAQQATPGQIFVSQTVRDVVVGSGIAFADRGVHEFDDVPGHWRLFVVEDVGGS